jgi:hypothetical protein
MLVRNERATRRVTNVRDDKILECRFWRGSFEERRCLVPAHRSASRAATLGPLVNALAAAVCTSRSGERVVLSGDEAVARSVLGARALLPRLLHLARAGLAP